MKGATTPFPQGQITHSYFCMLFTKVSYPLSESLEQAKQFLSTITWKDSRGPQAVHYKLSLNMFQKPGFPRAFRIWLGTGHYGIQADLIQQNKISTFLDYNELRQFLELEIKRKLLIIPYKIS